MENREKKANLISKVGSGLILALVLGYILYMVIVVKPESIGLSYILVIGGGVLGIWLLNDIITPIYAKEFEGKTEDEMRAYKLYAGLGLIGYFGLVFFACTMDRQSGMYGAIVYVVTLMMKRKFRDQYLGITDDDDEEDAEETEEFTFKTAQDMVIDADEEQPAQEVLPEAAEVDDEEENR